jgi:hypothetical protein
VTGCFRGIETNGVGAGTRVRRNTLRSNRYGVTLYQSDTTLVRVDSNGVSGADSSAVYVAAAYASLTHNRIEANAGDGLHVVSAMGSVTQAHDNAFVNNLRFAVVALNDSVDAGGNWWGSPSQPGGTPPNAVSGRVNTSTPLASPPANLPGLAPPVLRPSAGLLTTRPPVVAPALPPVASARMPAPAELRADRSLEARQERNARHAAIQEAKRARHAAARVQAPEPPQ